MRGSECIPPHLATCDAVQFYAIIVHWFKSEIPLMARTPIVHLPNYEGPLEVLWQLIHRHEIDIYQISLQQINEQYRKGSIESAGVDEEESDGCQRGYLNEGAEFVAVAASLAWLKSKTLLPVYAIDEEVEDMDPHFDIIHQLVDYCRFKSAAARLSQHADHVSKKYPRGIFVEGDKEVKKPLGIEQLPLNTLTEKLKQLLEKQGHSLKKGSIQSERWLVADKVTYWQALLKERNKVSFSETFFCADSKEEIIVTFLALLEMMKMGKACVALEDNQLYILHSKG